MTNGRSCVRVKLPRQNRQKRQGTVLCPRCYSVKTHGQGMENRPLSMKYYELYNEDGSLYRTRVTENDVQSVQSGDGSLIDKSKEL